jgi:hypothetical protein
MEASAAPTWWQSDDAADAAESLGREQTPARAELCGKQRCKNFGHSINHEFIFSQAS